MILPSRRERRDLFNRRSEPSVADQASRPVPRSPRASWGRFVAASAALACAVSGTIGASEASAADDDAVNHFDRWSPAVALQMGLLHQQADGVVVSNRRPPNQEGSPRDGDNLMLDYYFGLSVELMAPSILDIGGQPQPFIQFDVLHPLGLEVDIAREASPDGFNVPNFGVQTSNVPANAVGGQGSKTESEFKSPALAAAAGISFSFDRWHRRFRIRPSAGYFMERIEVNGLVLDAEGDQVVENGIVIEDFELTELSRASNKTLHAIGGGLEVEMEIAEFKSGRLAIGAGIHVYRLVGGRRFEFSTTQPREDPADGVSTATWSARLDPMLYRGGFSLRYRFSPD
jgi:hypothetical protein